MTAEESIALLKPGTVVLDVRPVIAAGGEPFGQIMEAVEKLEPGQGLAIRAPFKPSPLFGLMAAKGLQGQAAELAPGDWLVDFRPSGPSRPGEGTPGTSGQALPADPGFSILDVRGMEPPEPLMHIIAACNVSWRT